MDKEGRFLMGVALASGIVISTTVVAHTALKIKTDGENTIQVTGSAKRRIKSDLVVWTAKVSTRAPDLRTAYRALATATPKLTTWLEKQGVRKDQVKVRSVSTHKEHPHDKDGHEIADTIVAYQLEQEVEVRSGDVERVGQIANEATQLIEQGVELESNAPEYYYTKLGDLKIQMLAEAAKDSRVRAEQIATSTGSRIGPLRQARMGVIQINAADSTETSNEGNNDTSSLEKDIITVVGSTFALN
jgi:hypothetical protein